MPGSPEIEMLIQSLIGGGEPGAGAITPRLTAATKDLPGQQYKKMKKAKGGAKELPNMEPGLTGDPSTQALTDSIMSLITGAPAAGEMTPQLGMTKKGTIPANTNLMSTMVKKLMELSPQDVEALLGGGDGPDQEPDDDEDDGY